MFADAESKNVETDAWITLRELDCCEIPKLYIQTSTIPKYKK
jgi:hypothetical protein